MTSELSYSETITGYRFEWGEPHNIVANVNRLRTSSEDQIKGELEIVKGEGEERRFLLVPTQFNFSSERTRTMFAKDLTTKLDIDLEWKEIFDGLAYYVQELVRKGEPIVPIGCRPHSMKQDYQLRPILERNESTTLYGPGGSAKSYMADYIACLVQFGVRGVYGWEPVQGNVLYCDYESSPKDHERRVWAIKQGLGISTENTFLYRFCSQPLATDIASLQRLVREHNIALLVVDSQMAAAGYGPDPAQVSSQYYNALRSLRCTTLTIDHVSKLEWQKQADTDSTGPYGSVVKWNRARSVYEIRKSQAAGDKSLELALVHRKHNEGKLLPPVGIAIDFLEDCHEELTRVTFSPCDISDNPELSKVQTLKDQLTAVLAEGPRKVKDLANELGKPEATIRATLNRYKDTFVNTGEEWELRRYEV